jgi:hypothetical protein
MAVLDRLRERREQVLEIAACHGAYNGRVFEREGDRSESGEVRWGAKKSTCLRIGKRSLSAIG